MLTRTIKYLNKLLLLRMLRCTAASGASALLSSHLHHHSLPYQLQKCLSLFISHWKLQKVCEAEIPTEQPTLSSGRRCSGRESPAQQTARKRSGKRTVGQVRCLSTTTPSSPKFQHSCLSGPWHHGFSPGQHTCVALRQARASICASHKEHAASLKSSIWFMDIIFTKESLTCTELI